MNRWETFPKGTRLVLVESLYPDYPVTPGTKGTVTNRGQSGAWGPFMDVLWDTGVRQSVWPFAGDEIALVPDDETPEPVGRGPSKPSYHPRHGRTLQ